MPRDKQLSNKDPNNPMNHMGDGDADAERCPTYQGDQGLGKLSTEQPGTKWDAKIRNTLQD